MTEQKTIEDAVKRAREIYPMANEDDYPDNPNVNRLNISRVAAFMNGFSYASQFKSTDSVGERKTEEDSSFIGLENKLWMDLIDTYDTVDRSSYGYGSLIKALSEKFTIIRKL